MKSLLPTAQSPTFLAPWIGSDGAGGEGERRDGVQPRSHACANEALRTHPLLLWLGSQRGWGSLVYSMYENLDEAQITKTQCFSI